MPACWCRAGMSRYAPAPAAASPAPDRRHGRYCRTARWQRRASSALWRGLGRVSRGRASWLTGPPSILVLVAEPANQIGEVLGHPLTDHVVVHGAQLLADPRLNFAAQTSLGFVGIGGWRGHWILILRLLRDRLQRFKVGFAVLHCVVFSPFAHCQLTLGTPPLTCANALRGPIVPRWTADWNFFCGAAFLLVTSALWKGRVYCPLRKPYYSICRRCVAMRAL